MEQPRIIFEDEVFFIVDKPSGLTVNKSDTTMHEQTLQDWIEKEFTTENLQLKIDKESDFYKRSGIVHRLDKETSGVLVVAKTPEAFIDLQRQFKERSVEKTYTALAHGNVFLLEGEISVPVGRLSHNRRRFGIVAGGRESTTKYKVVSIKYLVSKKGREPLSLLELYPKTGRTHQIRVHLKYLGHPIFADELYAGRKTARQERKLLNRLFLHASKISFLHPVTKKRIMFESQLPSELQRLLNMLEE